MVEPNTNGGQPRATSRRTVLKIAGASAGALTIPSAGATAASGTDTRWRVALSFPTLAKVEGGDEVLFNVDAADGVVEGWEGYGYDGMFILPNDTQGADCGGWFDPCETYRASLPYILEWQCEEYDYGEVEVIVQTEQNSGTGYGAVHRFETGNESVSVESGSPGSDLLQPKFTQTNVVADNYFRPLDVELEVDFSNSSLRDGTESTTINAAIPNKGGVLDRVKNLVNTTDEIYSRGVDLADKTTPIDLNRMRKIGRYYGYAATVGIGLDSDLPRQAAISGIGAFTDPIKDYQERELYGENTVSTMGGPTIMNTE
ncbi:hypothetical protein [Natrinema halophilum]|uniref:Uncharacterized protein n=1 Tax=Natrinema halophilum TaxID=1699371 RepID=A0A7D5GFZ1_9EURY|nr:hypothetical protein [Natrinema halophilum]QLG47948.1 hypothetical protein HYG82_03360 [Natrinema halophilum]